MWQVTFLIFKGPDSSKHVRKPLMSALACPIKPSSFKPFHKASRSEAQSRLTMRKSNMTGNLKLAQAEHRYCEASSQVKSAAFVHQALAVDLEWE